MSHLPKHWQLDPAVKTRSALLESRRRNSLPDMTYDLDGDGVVSGKDYLISRQFDSQMKGKLEPAERAEALQFLQEGKDSAFLFGCDASGAARTIPIKQQRGLVIVGDDASQIPLTYPSFTTNCPQVKTQTELLQSRTKRNAEERTAFDSQIKEDFRMNLKIEDIVDYESYNKNPKFPSYSAKRRQERLENRQKCGLDIIDDSDKDFLINYKEKPQFSTLSEMKQSRRKEIVKSLNSSADFSYKMMQDRIMEREEIRAEAPKEGKTYGHVNARRKSLDFDHNQRVFGNRPLGVHGFELPKFEENCKEYWNIGKKPRQHIIVEHKEDKKIVVENNKQRHVDTDVVFRPRLCSFTDNTIKFRRINIRDNRPKTVKNYRKNIKNHNQEDRNSQKTNRIQRIRSSGFKNY